MTTFDEREAAFESKYAHDSAAQFRAESRANKKLAVWAAEKLGKSSADLDEYIKEVIRADMKEAGFEDVLTKVAEDLGGTADMQELRTLYTGFLSEAKAELAEG
ncbi:DUF1476 domain-containing protein [Celeribacter sp. PS-C1]|uniref:DUF1476 domain-containing protein n=1 Tax=Celeribacter sp. PS-C1 TaxID=2820813 RepID=UPI001C685C22|nr:DUF1476 domain-containing protein [Celeribacter sp. PS-C1]MBW6417677.1 DUF1476 domain-containing protein [Celeribacter sp. PS-C1]